MITFHMSHQAAPTVVTTTRRLASMVNTATLGWYMICESINLFTASLSSLVMSCDFNTCEAWPSYQVICHGHLAYCHNNICQPLSNLKSLSLQYISKSIHSKVKKMESDIHEVLPLIISSHHISFFSFIHSC